MSLQYQSQGELLDEMRRRISLLEESLRVQQQEADLLRQNEKKYLNLFRDSTIGMAEVTSDGRIAQVNKAYCDFLGYSEQELLGKTVLSLTHPDDKEATSQAIRRTFASGSRIHCLEKRYLRKDGQVVWGEVTNTLITDADGRPSYSIAQVLNINERKQFHEALVEREAQLLEAQEVADLGFYVLDLATGRWQSSSVLDRILGISNEYERTIDGWTNLVHPDERRERRDYLFKEVVGEGKPCDHEYRIVRYGDKQVRWVHGLGRIRFNNDGQPTEMIGTIQDITERKQAAEALKKAHDELEYRVAERTAELSQANQRLRQSHDELQAIYDGMVDGVILVDLETKRFIKVNATACRMLGYSEDELLSRSVMDIHPPKDLPMVLKAFQAQAAGQIAINENAPVLRKDGSVFYADIGAKLLVYQGRPTGIGFFHDITERKLAQEALQKEHRTLKHLLQSSDHERQTIAYEIHDGLAQYLAAAIMQFEVYRHLLETKPTDATKAYEGAMTLLRQGHFEARRLIAGVRPPVLDEAGVVEAIAHLINEPNRKEKPQIEFRSKVQFRRLVPILENAIYRICQEGLSNACKHSHSERVRINLLQDADWLRIDIRDWGIGFDRKKKKDGSYGLTGIRERARLLGGKCRIQSAAGRGTRITVELPLMEREE